ncbi:SDR family NAD(P)-dependent oxidoreductase [Promicromonospora thailandica]|uniref:NAD(P)-dependent dehydrogenase, short-chain alcohol dehydrogenase family n=1 Tax=Promicromonospora thailandica TaxID=765201 RepID=A0A9X2GAT7_9MICO|nr:SDR family NAD(P)-dependent oxidoreductase [Promicromonospora thailandica]MCP2265766.1 NAD(P)-dependent dehydrogenase, short-chain alcohol dehydrogenase family [Promicromonospora thailandica]
MTSRTSHSAQHPLGTGFTPASTADDVLRGIDLTGTNVIVTGGHNGIGHETTRALAAAGATVTVAARNPDRAAERLAGIPRVETSRLDLMDPASVDAFVGRYLDSGRALHVLVNNAGIMAGPLVRDARGYESQLATNHLGHFQLTLGLLPALRAAHGARVVNLTSGGHRLSDIRWDDPHFTSGYDDLGMLAYGQSKTANVLFAVELDRRWAADGIRGYAVHPGIVMTTSLGPFLAEGEERTPWLDDDAQRAMGLVDEAGELVIDPYHEKKTVQQGASTSVFAATSPLLADVGGVYLKDNDVSPLDESPQRLDFTTEQNPAATVVPHAIDPVSARRLWALSEELVRAGTAEA